MKKCVISNLGTIVTGKTPSTKNENYWGNEIPFVTPKDIQSSKHIFNTERYLTTNGANSVKGCILPPKSICVSCIGNIGYTSMTIDRAVSNQQINSIIVNNEHDIDFVYYLMKSLWSYFKNYEGQSTTVSILNKSQFSKIEILIPDNINIERKIAAILSSLDNKIELNQRVNNNLEQQAQTLFKSIYSSENNGILADIVNIAESGSRPKGGALRQGIPSVGAENVEKFGVYDYSKEKFISEEFYSQMKRGKVLSEDVLLYKDGAYTGKVSLALDGFPHKVCAVNEHVFIIRGKPNISSQFFIYFCLSYEANKNYLHTLACSKAAQPGLNQSELLGLPIFIPLPDTVKKFTNIVSPLMHKIAANALENIKLASIRDTLLPKLMSGEIDVSDVNISADKSSFSDCIYFMCYFLFFSKRVCLFRYSFLVLLLIFLPVSNPCFCRLRGGGGSSGSFCLRRCRECGGCRRLYLLCAWRAGWHMKSLKMLPFA